MGSAAIKFESSASASPPAVDNGKRALRNNNKDEDDINKGKPSITKADIGPPTNFRHVGHIGWDPDKGFEVENSETELKDVVRSSGMSESVYSFLEENGAIEKPNARTQQKQKRSQAPSVRPSAPAQRAMAPFPPPQTGSQRDTIQRKSSQSWYWQEDDGTWKPFDVSAGSVDSDQIERAYQHQQHGSFSFSLNSCSYVIQFSSNIQTNIKTSRQRKVERRLVQHDWYWREDNDQWKQYDSMSGGVSSAQITASFNRNHSEGFQFTLDGCSYVIDFINMMQTNVTTGKTRRVECRTSSISPTQQIPVLPSSHDWYWQGNDQTWHLFSGSISSDFIEAKFAANPSSSFTFKHGDNSYRIDLSTMTQTNLSTSKTRQIVRTPKGVAPQRVSVNNNPPPPLPPRIQIPPAQPKTAYPQSWNLNAPAKNGVALVDVKSKGPTTREFNEVSKLFNESMPDTALKSVTRVQNKQLWEKFNLAKKQLETRLGPEKGIRSLFHGTKQVHIGGICSQGFDPRLSGTSAGVNYGQGSYFAVNANKSRSYADSNTLFIAQVLVGESAVGEPEMRRPPRKDLSNRMDYCTTRV